MDQKKASGLLIDVLSRGVHSSVVVVVIDRGDVSWSMREGRRTRISRQPAYKIF